MTREFTKEEEEEEKKEHLLSTIIPVSLDFFCRGNQVASSSITISLRRTLSLSLLRSTPPP
jgi:hypothetical protein